MKYTYDDENFRLSVDLDEELDVSSCKSLRSIIDGYIMRYEPKEFILNLTHVKFMDSSGIGLLIGRYNLIKLLDSKMTIINATQSIKRVLELSNITKNINLRSE
ncbi:MAG: anti-sigma factor antagonist [Clostridia bacterium]|nr:anti-sigma factor antagonist [Clostridia bacterium]MDD4386214.1 anti-sigma factor antagonist [Clostridia bacterium]